MLYYLDTVVVIYAVEGNPADQQRALNHLSVLEQAGHRFAIRELTRTECLVPVFGPGGGQRLSDFFRFFHGPNLRTLGLTAARSFRDRDRGYRRTSRCSRRGPAYRRSEVCSHFSRPRH